MKKSLIFIVGLVALTLFGPIMLMGASPSQENRVKSVSAPKNNIKNDKVIFKLKTKNNEIIKIDASDYLLGCVAAEMPISYHEEALKAQTVAAYTYALRKKANSKNDYDITDDYKTDQCYIADEELKTRWGDNYGQNKEKLEKIIKSVEGEWVCFDKNPALTVYHAISSGKTYDAKEVWGQDIKYLKSVDSSFDKMEKNYKTVQKFNKEEFLKLLELEGKIKSVKIDNLERTKNGRVKNFQISGEKISGVTAMQKLNLRSDNYSVDTDDENVIFTVLGYGHGVGMSQTGANAMAKNGSNYKEILHHYYSGCSIEKD